jgi:hypothetical protein
MMAHVAPDDVEQDGCQFERHAVEYHGGALPVSVRKAADRTAEDVPHAVEFGGGPV